MLGRMATWMLGLALVAGLPAGAMLATDLKEVTLRRDDDYVEVVAVDDDDDGDTNSRSGYTSGVDSNDRTGSGHTAVSRDGERSRGDKTRDRTRDGKGDHLRRDWSGGQTNDRSRNDTR